MKVLVFLEQRDGKLKQSSLEALTLAHHMSPNPDQVAGVLVGHGIQNLAREVEGYGAGKIYLADHPDLALYNGLGYTGALEKAVGAFGPDTLLGVASPMGRDIFPRLAARLGAGLITDVTQVDLVGGVLSGALKPMYAGKVIAKIEYQGTGLRMATLRPNSYKPEKVGQGNASVEALSFDLPENSGLKTLEIRKGKTAKVDLSEASRIISGGRSLQSAENFKILATCAEVLGATVGASRAAVDAGFASHDMQVGQTGKTVSPNLYIACGISGAIQHMAGMRTSKVIVAINTDPEAPIFSVADYGIVGDLFKVVPMLEEELKKLS